MDIVEEDINLVGFKGDDENESDGIVGNQSDDNEDNEIDSSEQEQSRDNENEKKELRRSNRPKAQPKRYADENYAYCIYVNYVSADSPLDYNDVMNSEYYKDWQKAMNKEMDCLNKNQTWTLVERPKDKKNIRFEMGLYKKG